MRDTGPYREQYAEFWNRRDDAFGYHFGKAPVGNVAPPTLQVPKPLRWWSWDRPRRLRAILRRRDQWLAEIIKLGTASTTATGQPVDAAHIGTGLTDPSDRASRQSKDEIPDNRIASINPGIVQTG